MRYKFVEGVKERINKAWDHLKRSPSEKSPKAMTIKLGRPVGPNAQSAKSLRHGIQVTRLQSSNGSKSSAVLAVQVFFRLQSS